MNEPGSNRMRYPGQREDLTPLEWRQRLHDEEVRRKVRNDAAAGHRVGYCVYVHRDASGRVRYVGHGQRHRAWCCKRSHHRHVDFLLNGDLIVELIVDGVTAHEAVELETCMLDSLKSEHEDVIFNVLDGTWIETPTGEIE